MFLWSKSSGFLTLLSQSPSSLGGELGCIGPKDLAAGYLPDSFLPHSLNPCLFQFLRLTDHVNSISRHSLCLYYVSDLVHSALPTLDSPSKLCDHCVQNCSTFPFTRLMFPGSLYHCIIYILYTHTHSSVYKCEAETTPDISSAKFH